MHRDATGAEVERSEWQSLRRDETRVLADVQRLWLAVAEWAGLPEPLHSWPVARATSHEVQR